MRRAVGIVRVSTDQQELSPVAQAHMQRAWADAHGMEYVGPREELDVSGGLPLDERPVLLAAVAELRKGDVLLATRRDRFARSVLTACLLERLVQERGATLATTDGSGDSPGPEGALMRHILDAFAEYERAVISLRTRMAMAVKVRRGERVGRYASTGYRLEGGVQVEDAREREMVAEAGRLREMPTRPSLRLIAKCLNDQGYRTRNGGKLGPSQVSRMLATKGQV